MVSCLLGANHSEHCKAVHLNYIPISFGFGMPSLTNPWHLASYVNAKLPIVNWFPLFISQEEMGYLESNTRFFERERGEKGFVAILLYQILCLSDMHTMSKDKMMALNSCNCAGDIQERQALDSWSVE